MSPSLGITTKRGISYRSPQQHAAGEPATGAALPREVTRSLLPRSCPRRGRGFAVTRVFSHPRPGSVATDSVLYFHAKRNASRQL